jgi:predicted amidohydrolase
MDCIAIHDARGTGQDFRKKNSFFTQILAMQSISGVGLYVRTMIRDREIRKSDPDVMTALQPVNTMVDAGRAAAENGAGFYNCMANRCALPA